MLSNLAVDLRRARPPAELDVGDGQLIEFAPSRVFINGARATKAEALAALVRAYRASPTPASAGVLLDLLAPSIVHRLQHLEAQPPALDAEDIRQELVLSVLCAAATMRLPSNPKDIRNALIKRANLMVTRRLDKEFRHRRWHRSLEALEDAGR